MTKHKSADGQQQQVIQPDIAEIKRALALMTVPGEVYELRVLGYAAYNREITLCGYFNDYEKLAAAAAEVSPEATGVYVTLNPVSRDLLARSCNKLKDVKKGQSTSDQNVVRRTRLVVDLDPQRPAGISSSEEEHDNAIERARFVRDALSERYSFPAPVLADSGNGAHLVYEIDLPADDGGHVRDFLRAVAFLFGGWKSIGVDTTLGNASRISKLYGTLARKGEDIPERPHRLSQILDAPKVLGHVSEELLRLVIAEMPQASGSGRRAGSSDDFDLAVWLKQHQVPVEGPQDWDGASGKARVWTFAACPWDAEHNRGEARVGQFVGGGVFAGCFHAGCTGKGWPELRAAYERSGMEVEDDEAEDGSSAVSWPAPLADAAKIGLAGEFLDIVAPHSEADPVSLLSSFFVAFGNVVGRHSYSVAEEDQHHSNLFVALVGETSKGRKGSSWNHVRQRFGGVDSIWSENNVLSGLSSGEGLIWQVRDPITKLKDGAPEVIDDGVADKRLLIVEPEFAQTVTAMDRHGNILSAVLREAWDSGDLRTLVKNSPAKASGAHVSIVTHITKAELERCLHATESYNGFANRFLWFCVRRSKFLPEGGKPDAARLRAFETKLRGAVDFAAKGERLIIRDDGASRVWCEIYRELSEGQPGLFGAVTARSEAQVLRLSVIYALLDRSAVVRPEHLLAAVALWEYSLNSCRWIFGDSLGDPAADEILAGLRSHPEGMTRTEISSELFSRNERSSTISRALRVLQINGKARFVKEGRTERWFPA